MADLIDDRQKQRILGANARRLFEQHFVLENMFSRTLALYEAILAKQPAVG